MRKWGQASDGEHWEHIAQEDTWYEGVANVDFANARDHSPQLLNVLLREKMTAAGAAGDDAAGAGPTLKPPVRRPPPKA